MSVCLSARLSYEVYSQTVGAIVTQFDENMWSVVWVWYAKETSKICFHRNERADGAQMLKSCRWKSLIFMCLNKCNLQRSKFNPAQCFEHRTVFSHFKDRTHKQKLYGILNIYNSDVICSDHDLNLILHPKHEHSAKFSFVFIVRVKKANIVGEL